MENPATETVKQILEQAKTIAVVGLSDKPQRTSHQISSMMQDQGFRIIPINPKLDEVLGEKAYSSLTDVSENIDIINIFRRSEFLPSVAEDAAKTNATVFWAQQGVANEEAFTYLKKHGFTVMMDSCIKVAHSVLIGNK